MSTRTLQILRIVMPALDYQDVDSSPAKCNAVVPKLRPSPAASEAFEIYELLELILLHLPIRDLLLAQRVDRHWKSVIDSSKPIQRALHFLPAPYPASIPPPPYPRTATFFKPNPLRTYAFRRALRVPRYNGNYNVHHLAPPLDKQYNIEAELFSTPEWDDAVRYEHASWRRMLFTQPPVTHVTIVDMRVAPDYDDCFCEEVENLKGVRMGDLLVLDEVSAAHRP